MFIFLKWFEPLRSFNFDAIYWSCKTAKNPRDQKLDSPSQHLLITYEYDERGGPDSTGQGKSRIPTS